MAPDQVAFTADDPQPAAGAADARERLTILHLLSRSGAAPEQIAEQLGLPRESVDRHLIALRDRGLVKAAPDRANGPVHALDAAGESALSAGLASTVKDGVGVPSAEAASTSAPPSPEACTRCENGPFVRQVLDELDRALADTRQYRDRLRLMSSQVIAAQEEERKRIARELHDDTAQALTSLLVRLRALERSAESSDVRAGLDELRGLTRATLDGVRRMSVDLRPQALDDLGLAAALKAYVQDFSRRWPIEATFAGDAVAPLPSNVELVLYRIVQEALSNVARHAGASRARVLLTRDAHTLRLLVEDDGCGFDALAAKSSREGALGLFGMAERLALIGGVLHVDSAPGRGTRVTADVPLPGSELRSGSHE